MFHPPAPVIILRFADDACSLAKAFYLLWKAFAFWRRRSTFCGVHLHFGGHVLHFAGDISRFGEWAQRFAEHARTLAEAFRILVKAFHILVKELNILQNALALWRGRSTRPYPRVSSVNRSTLVCSAGNTPRYTSNRSS